jgi:hypothetical protein
MRLADLRKLSIKKQIRIRFILPNGLECVVNEHGVAQVPALKAVPDFNLEDALAAVSQFSTEAAAPDPKKGFRRQTLSRVELAALSSDGSEAQHHDDHDE